MEVLESGEQGALQWDRKLSELSEPGDPEALLYHTVSARGAGRAARGARCQRGAAGHRGPGWGVWEEASAAWGHRGEACCFSLNRCRWGPAL